jgi:hypothetical protein
MSTILKALRRLEQEKAGKDRPLREQVTGLGGGSRDDPGASRRWPILLGGIGAGVTAGAAVLLLALSASDPAPPPAAAVAALPGAEDAPPPSAAPLERRATLSPPAVAPAAPAASVVAPPAPLASDEVEVVDRGLPGPRIDPAPVELPAATQEGPVPGSVRPFQHAERRAQPAARRLPQEEPAAAPPPSASADPSPVTEAAPPSPAPPPVRETAPPSPSLAAPARPEAASAPRRAAPSPPDPFPALRVERTTWHPLAERRLAVVDVAGEGARELREGDPVAGATVATIEPSGVVFRFDGRDVRRKVGATH